ncbi:hypothetical protein CEP54_013533 [Fusarium duplospermum]|uniref:Uncharacterized protein n=1 Tax=Fusarium duplospermum TaxID=1325734 RepID=A0A428P296_9HYPO|nr:hypothetical protein CEP54_013533 [Fusarium duplospermum]
MFGDHCVAPRLHRHGAYVKACHWTPPEASWSLPRKSLAFFQRHPALDLSTYQDLPTKHFTVPHNNNKQHTMGLFWSKGIGGRHFGTSIHVDKNGVRRGPWRFSLGKFSCFRA